MERAKRLGISEKDLTQALLLIRDLRLRVLERGIDPRATRIAIIYANLVDYHWASKILSKKELWELEQIARELYNLVKNSQQE